jgi:hypothetical protein
MKISKSAQEKFEWFCETEQTLQCLNSMCALEGIYYDPSAHTALECFHLKESTGVMPKGCVEPLTLAKALLGKKFHGVTIETAVDMLLEGLTNSDELKSQFPFWVLKEIRTQASKKALGKIGYVPTFIKNIL